MNSGLNILIPLYENKLMAKDCLISVSDFARCNPKTSIMVWISDDSSVSIASGILEEVSFGDNVDYRVCPKRNKTSLNNAVDNWNYLLSHVPEEEYYVLLHHDERLPIERLSLGVHDLHILALKGIANRRSSYLGRYLTAFVLRFFPKILLYFNIIGPTACVITNQRERFNSKLQWLVDVDYYVKLIKAARSIKFHFTAVQSVPNDRSITNSIDHYILTLREARLLGVGSLGLMLLRFKYYLKRH